MAHPWFAEAAVVGIPDPIKGQGIAVFVTLRDEMAKKVLSKEMHGHFRFKNS